MTLAEKMKRINEVSPCFCLAKWLQVTIDLVCGTTHSCHHPLRHQVPLDELHRNPGALHNTSYKMQMRRKMLNGERPSECHYCWEMEDSGVEYSDRFVKSTDEWSFDQLEKIKHLPWNAEISPTYLEVMIDDICNFSCSYCIPDVSTGVEMELKRFGNYSKAIDPVRKSRHRKIRGDNPYVDAFFKWLPKILPDLKVLRLTGGEPLLSSRLDEILNLISLKTQRELTLIVNTHLSHTDQRIDSFANKINSLIDNQNIKGFEIYTSLDTVGAQAEFIRHGLNYEWVIKNLVRLSEKIPHLKLVVMCTYNLLSIPRFDQFLDDVIELKKRKVNLTLDISTLRNPIYLRADIADSNLVDLSKRSLTKMDLHPDLFSTHERSKMQNVVSWMGREISRDVVRQRRREFVIFIDEYSRRKRRKFLDIFPELREFYIASSQALLSSFDEEVVTEPHLERRF